jgi:hypothetical protein
MTATQTVRVESPAVRLCVECELRPIRGKGEKARFCEDCIGRHHAGKPGNPRKYVPTENIDRIIREHYLKRVTNGGHPRSLPTLRELGRTIGWPKEVVVRRAMELGLTRSRIDDWWSAEEFALLERYAHLTPNRISIRFAKAGYKRSAVAINLQIKRKHLRSSHDFYSANYLAELFGVDRHLIARWIRLKYLKAKPRGTDRGPECGGDEYLLKDEWVRDFVMSHPTAFDIRKVDQVWFLNMLMQGRLCGGPAGYVAAE